MAALMILIVSMVALARSAVIVDPPPTPGPAYVAANKSPDDSAPTGSVQPGVATILAIPLSVVATSDDHADDAISPAGVMQKVVANVVEKVVDVVTEVREKVADVVDNVRDKVSDIVDDAKAGGSSHGVADTNSNKGNDTKTDDSDETDPLDDNSEELKSDSGNSTENANTSTDDNSKDNDKKDKDDDDSKNEKAGKSSKEDKQKDDSKEEISGKDKVNGTDDSGERKSESKKDDDDSDDNHKHDEDSREKEDGGSVWSWLKHVTGDIEQESGDDDTKVRHYLTHISKMKSYLDAMDSNIAVSMAKQSGTCPVYPIQVGNNRVTITTENGCKIIIKLKGLTVDKIEDGREEKKRAHKRSILVSYSDN